MNLHPFCRPDGGRIPVATGLLLGFWALSTPLVSTAQYENAPYNERLAEASVIITESHRYEGSFGLTTIARVCGELPGELNFSGLPSFVVQFYPEDGQGPIRDITFGSTELVGGVTTTSNFFLTTVVYAPSIGSPPAYVLDPSKPNVSGTAELSYPEPGTEELTVNGVNEMGEVIRMTLKCGPRE